VPELPEVETTRRGIARHVLGEAIDDVIVRDRRLRWPVPHALRRGLRGLAFERIDRRAKYLLFRAGDGCMILHLGMSGSLRIVGGDVRPGKHDHVDFVFASGKRLRFRDPRRFGSIHWTTDDPARHPLLRSLGPEPFDPALTGAWLHARARGRTQAVKNFIMDSRTIVGVGNIYANESLHAAGIRPQLAAGRVSRPRYDLLLEKIRDVLSAAIGKGGTTLRDFTSGVGEPGYFRMELRVYERADEPCLRCGARIRSIRLGQRSAFYCPRCQR
jgi:formamidopyrimidine-DNA glycosylase